MIPGQVPSREGITTATYLLTYISASYRLDALQRSALTEKDEGDGSVYTRYSTVYRDCNKSSPLAPVATSAIFCITSINAANAANVALYTRTTHIMQTYAKKNHFFLYFNL